MEPRYLGEAWSPALTIAQLLTCLSRAHDFLSLDAILKEKIYSHHMSSFHRLLVIIVRCSATLVWWKILAV